MRSGAAAPILVLGGTSEAGELARALAGRGHDVVESLAGITTARGSPSGRRRIGGFGGVAGLLAELRRDGYGMVVDGTHPFAARMAHQAAVAAAQAGVPHLRLLRPPWQRRPGDIWHEVDGFEEAAHRLVDIGARRAFLAIGRTQLAAFATLSAMHIVIRSIESPGTLPFQDTTVILARGPFGLDAELALLSGQRIDALVTRNSGGRASSAKLDAARQLGIAVVMVRRPEGLKCEQVATVPEALVWIEAHLAATSTS